MRGIGIRGAGMIPVSMQGGGQGAAFSPANITGLRLWLKADTGIFTDDAATTPATADGDVIAVWQDQSGNGYHVSQTDNAKRPLLKLAANGINGRNSILFDGSNDQLVRTVANWLSGDSQGSVYAVLRLTQGLISNQTILGSGDEAAATKYITLRICRALANPCHQVVQTSADAADSIQGNGSQVAGFINMVSIKSNGAAYSMRNNEQAETLTVVGGANNGDWFADTADRDNFSVGGLKLNTEIHPLKGAIAELVLTDGTETAAQALQIEAYLHSRYFSGATQLIYDGNSMTQASVSTYPGVVNDTLTAAGMRVFGWNFGLSGQTTADMIADAVAQIDPLLLADHNPILIAWEGSNDLKLGATAADAYARLVTYCQARQAAGFQVVIVTILPRSDAGTPGSFNADRNTVNGNILANWATFADAVADLTTDHDISDDGDSEDVTYYTDKVHMTAAGYAKVAAIVAAAIGTL